MGKRSCQGVTVVRDGCRSGVAGGPSKYQALRAALLGGWLNIVVTDATTAQWLIDNRR